MTEFVYQDMLPLGPDDTQYRRLTADGVSSFEAGGVLPMCEDTGTAIVMWWLGHKSYPFQETKAVLNPAALMRFLDEKLRTLDTAACPPYHLAVVIGGTSAEYCLKVAKYASAKYLDTLPTTGNELGRGFRDVELEQEVLALSQQFGIVEQFQSAGGSFVMLAKGNRSRQVTDACRAHGGFYLGSIGGPAARLAQDCITKVEVLEYPELGMEAVWSIEVVDFPAFVVVDYKGNDFLAEVSTPVAIANP